MELLKVLNHDRSVGRKTVIVFGCGRGGTSAMAGFLRELGVIFPPVTHPLRHESSPIRYVSGRVDRLSTRMAVDAMNLLGKTWGWKSPRDIFSFSEWVSLIENPHFVIILRNPLDIMISAARRDSVGLSVAAEAVGSAMAKLGEFIAYTPLPISLVSYEDLCRQPQTLAREMAEWLTLDVSEVKLQNAVQFVRRDRRGYRLLQSEGGLHLEEAAAELAVDRVRVQLELYRRANAELSRVSAALTEDITKARGIIDGMSRQVMILSTALLAYRTPNLDPTEMRERVRILLDDLIEERSLASTFEQTDDDEMFGHSCADEEDRKLAESTYYKEWAKFSATLHERLCLQREMDDLIYQQDWLDEALMAYQSSEAPALGLEAEATGDELFAK